MNQTYKDLTIARAHAAISAARAASSIVHSGLKGQLREIVIRELLRPLFPPDIGVGTGEIITSIDQHSTQQDIVIYDRSIVPPILLDEHTGIFPVESALFAIEIKSVLTASELKSSITNAIQLKSLRYLPGEYGDDGKSSHEFVKGVIPCVLALDSDLNVTGKTEIERVQEILEGASDDPPVQVICVVGRGCWSWRNTDQWHAWPRSESPEELVAFVAAIMNSYKQIALSRRAPRMGHYFF